MGMQNEHKISPKRDDSYVTKETTGVGGWAGVKEKNKT